jgi:cell division GTPase FtsZ
VTRPFSFEGKVRKINSDLGIQLIKDYVDALVSSSRMIGCCRWQVRVRRLKKHLKWRNDVLLMGVKGITDLIVQHPD